jgi:anti-anti-sigma factor
MNIMHKVEKSVLVLSLKGNLTSEIDVNELKKAIQNHVNPMTKRVVVDLERVDHISGLAISWLLGTRKLMEKYQGKLHLTSINSNVREILTRTDLVKFFKIYPTVYEALKIK